MKTPDAARLRAALHLGFVVGSWIVWRRCYASTLRYSYQGPKRRRVVRVWLAFGAWRRLDYGKHFVS